MSHRICKTAKELSEAIKEETDVIEVEGDLSNKIVRIKVTEKSPGRSVPSPSRRPSALQLPPVLQLLFLL